MTAQISTTCCISGGGPAGLMAGYLLARAGVDVIVLEKHKDFLRDFRGDTIHPSTIALMDELGIIVEFLALPHTKVSELAAVFGSDSVPLADFSQLKTRHKYIAFMPQWDFLNFIAEKARGLPHFKLMMSTEARTLIEEDGCICGVKAHGQEDDLEIRADLTLAADGRFSELRDQSGLVLRDFGAPMDVLWFNLPKPEAAPPEPLGRFLAGKILILIDRGTNWQAGYVIPKGDLGELRQQDFAAFIETLAAEVPQIAEPLQSLTGWDDLKLLNVQVNRLVTWWRPGFLCIGDAAHAMSPVGGVGINLAVQDAVATANLLAAPLRNHVLSTDDLRAVQKRRLWPAKVTQGFQVFVQKRIISNVLQESGTVHLPFPLHLLRVFPYLRRFPAQFIGIGVRAEHIAPLSSD